MPKSANQKLKLLYLMQYPLQKSNESHPVTIQQMVDELACYMALRPSAKPYISAVFRVGVRIRNGGGNSCPG